MKGSGGGKKGTCKRPHGRVCFGGLGIGVSLAARGGEEGGVPTGDGGRWDMRGGRGGSWGGGETGEKEVR